MLRRAAIAVFMVAALALLLLLLPALLGGAPEGDPGVPPVQLRPEAG